MYAMIIHQIARTHSRAKHTLKWPKASFTIIHFRLIIASLSFTAHARDATQAVARTNGRRLIGMTVPIPTKGSA